MFPGPTIPNRQPHCDPWSRKHLFHEHAVAMGNAIDSTSCYTYGSALNSYLTFIRIHHMPVKPMEETLSFFVVFASLVWLRRIFLVFATNSNHGSLMSALPAVQ